MPGKSENADISRACILHIGTAKTGTTALQFGLTGYDDERTTYARLPTAPDNPNHSETLVLAGYGSEGVKARLNDFDAWSAAEDKLRWPNSFPLKTRQRTGKVPDAARHEAALAECMRETSHQRLIFSGESLFSNFNCAPRLLGQLGQSFGDIDVVCYLRACAGACLSRFQQRLTASDPKMFFAKNLREELNLLVYNDAHHLQKWQDATTGHRLVTAIYDRDVMKNGDVVEDFCDRFALDPARARRVRSNASFSAEATAVLATLSHFGSAPPDNPHFARNKRFFDVLMYQYGTGKLSLSDAFAHRLHAANADALDWIDRQCGQAFTRRPTRGSHVLDHHEDLLAICEDLLPDLKVFLKRMSGLRLGWRVRGLESFGRALSKALCRPNPFPHRQLPAGFSGEQYKILNPDVARAGADPAEHFMALGCYEGRFY